MIAIEEIPAPADWASYLINGDDSGLNDEEREACHDWLSVNELTLSDVVDVERDDDGEAFEPWFTWSYGYYGGTAQGGSCLNYIIHRAEPADKPEGYRVLTILQ